jgi:small-conductance mechanosensitive channel
MQSAVTTVEGAAAALLAFLSDPWTLAQLSAIGLAIGAALVLNRWVEPWLEDHVRGVRSRPKLLRLLAVVLRRTRWILAALLLWLAGIALEATGRFGDPELVGVAAVLASAWVAISVATKLIRNRTLARGTAFLGWGLLALAALDLLGPAARMLDAYAFSLGSLRVSALAALKGLAIAALLFWLAGLLSHLVERSVGRNTDIDPSFRVLIGKVVKLALFVAVVVATLSTIGLDLTTLTVFSGAIGLGLGFGLQKVVSNLVSGFIILLDKSIKPGDVIQLGDTFGSIHRLRARFVSVNTRDGRKYLIPNEELITRQVVNWSFDDDLVRLDVPLRASYDSDPHLVRRLAVEAASGVKRVLPEPEPVCHLLELGEYSLKFVLRFWISDPANGVTNVRGRVLLACWDSFKANGVRVPLPQREVILRDAAGLEGGEAEEPPPAQAPPRLRSLRPGGPPSA